MVVYGVVLSLASQESWNLLSMAVPRVSLSAFPDTPKSHHLVASRPFHYHALTCLSADTPFLSQEERPPIR